MPLLRWIVEEESESYTGPSASPFASYLTLWHQRVRAMYFQRSEKRRK
jgi:hypothetical protein